MAICRTARSTAAPRALPARSSAPQVVMRVFLRTQQYRPIRVLMRDETVSCTTFLRLTLAARFSLSARFPSALTTSTPAHARARPPVKCSHITRRGRGLRIVSILPLTLAILTTRLIPRLVGLSLGLGVPASLPLKLLLLVRVRVSVRVRARFRVRVRVGVGVGVGVGVRVRIRIRIRIRVKASLTLSSSLLAQDRRNVVLLKLDLG